MGTEQKVVVITGASQGFGAALVNAYRDRNYRVKQQFEMVARPGYFHRSIAGVARPSAIHGQRRDGAPPPICSRSPRGSPLRSATSPLPSIVAGAGAP
jgi:hypothetical protein